MRPYHPYASDQACCDNVTFVYLTGQLRPDFHTIAAIALFRRRFRKEIQRQCRPVRKPCRASPATMGLTKAD